LPATSKAIRGAVASFERTATRLGARSRRLQGRKTGEAAIDCGKPMASVIGAPRARDAAV
jgi:hypothetical protein